MVQHSTCTSSELLIAAAIKQRLCTCVVVLFLLLLVGAVHAQPARIQSFEFEVRLGDSMYWVNDQEIVFKALVQVDKSQATGQRHNMNGRLAMLDTEKKTIVWSDEFPNRVCADGNHIAFTEYEEIVNTRGRTERFWIAEGSIQSFRKRQVEREDTSDHRRLDFEYSCKPVSELPVPPAAIRDKPFKRLRPEHGFVELERDTTTRPELIYPVKFHPAGAGIATSIDALRGVDIDPLWPYFPFRNAYWVRQRVRYDPLVPPGIYKSWWLRPDGRVTVAVEFDLARTFRVWRSWTPTIPVRDGFLTLQERGRPNRIFGDIGDAGVYRFDAGGKHEKLASGLVAVWAVSPDGCKVAVGIDDKRERTDRYFLKVLHVCKG